MLKPSQAAATSPKADKISNTSVTQGDFHTKGFPAHPIPILSQEMPGWADLSSPESPQISPDLSLCCSTDQNPPKLLLLTVWFVIIHLGVTLDLTNPQAPTVFCHQQLSTGEGSKIIPFLCPWSSQKYHSTEGDQ